MRPHARSKLVQAHAPNNGHCHSYLVAYCTEKVVDSATNAQSIKKIIKISQ